MSEIEFNIFADYGMIRVGWVDGEYAYHVNLNAARQVKGASWRAGGDKPVIIRRPIVGGDATFLDFNAKKYAAIRDAISNIPESAFQEAFAESERKEAARRAEQEAKRHAEDMEELQRLAEQYGYKLVKA